VYSYKTLAGHLHLLFSTQAFFSVHNHPTLGEMNYLLRPSWSLLTSLKNIIFPATRVITATPNLDPPNLTSLDSPSATRQADDKEKAPTYFIMPDLVGDCPFPLGRHPNADELTAEATQWLVDRCPELSPKCKQALWGLQVRNFVSYV
jgi:hypothetical protein